MNMPRNPEGLLRRYVAIATMAMLILTGLFSGSTSAREIFVNLSGGGGAPQASGTATIELRGREAIGRFEVDHLPAQPFGSGRFYGAWFVRTDTGDKAALGALISKRENSIIFSARGEGEMEFSATHFTTGPNSGSPITFGPPGSNFIVVLIENNINGLTPSPVGPVPGTGVAVGGTF